MSNSRMESADSPVTPGSPGGWGPRSERALASARESEQRAAPRKAPRRGAVDPVKALMHHHHELCEQAVDPLEIAAGLEAHGVTDRTAARFRHRDVFSLAEEMYARVPRGAEQGAVTEPPRARAEAVPPVPAGWGAVAMLPGAVCAAAVAGVSLASGQARLVALAAGVLAVLAALRMALRYGPLRVAVRVGGTTRAWTCWLLAYALAGDGLVRGLTDGVPPGDWALRTSVVLALALAVAPAAWCARIFAVRAGHRLAQSRGLEDFAAAVRPLLYGVLVLFLAAVLALLVIAGRVLGAPLGPVELAAGAALAALLLLGRLLAVYRAPEGVGAVLAAVCAVEAAALGVTVAGRLPERFVPFVPLVACGAGAAVLLIRAARRLTLASAHARGVREAQCPRT